MARSLLWLMVCNLTHMEKDDLTQAVLASTQGQTIRMKASWAAYRAIGAPQEQTTGGLGPLQVPLISCSPEDLLHMVQQHWH